MERIVIEVADDTAKKWRRVSPKAKIYLENFFKQQIDDLDRKSKLAHFDELLKRMSEEAEANGLTEEILQEILKEDD